MQDPEKCENMQEIRNAIDLLDRRIIHLIGERFQYVKAAAKFKKNNEEVRAPERFQSMLVKRREWAQEEGLDPDAIEKMYSDLVRHFIAAELEYWEKEGHGKPEDNMLT